jgi:MinD superfamily P-loop ATPase
MAHNIKEACNGCCACKNSCPVFAISGEEKPFIILTSGSALITGFAE